MFVLGNQGKGLKETRNWGLGDVIKEKSKWPLKMECWKKKLGFRWENQCKVGVG